MRLLTWILCLSLTTAASGQLRLPTSFRCSSNTSSRGTTFASIDLVVTMEAIMPLIQQHLNPILKLNPFDKLGDKSKVSAGFAGFPEDIAPNPRKFAERFFTVRHWDTDEKGGHFRALENLDPLAADIRNFINSL